MKTQRIYLDTSVHIVRFDKIRLFNAANLEQGYKQLAIHSPREVTTYEQD